MSSSYGPRKMVLAKLKKDRLERREELKRGELRVKSLWTAPKTQKLLVSYAERLEGVQRSGERVPPGEGHLI